MANMFWASFNLLIGILCLGWTLRRRQRREAFRFLAHLPAVVRTGGRTLPVTVEDLHEKGASLITSRFIKVGSEVDIDLDSMSLKGEVLYMVVRGDVRKYGVRFVDLDRSASDRIKVMTSLFLTEKIMKEKGEPPPTPLMRFFRLWKIRFRRRSKREPSLLPGVLVTNRGMVPFSAEDMSSYGLRVVTPCRLEDRHLIVEIDGKVFRYGKVVWEKEIALDGFRAYRYGVMFLKEGKRHDGDVLQNSAA